MIVHFPIALFFTAALLDLIGAFGKVENASKMGFVLETLGMISLGAAAAAGWVSEHAVTIQSPAALAILHTHKVDAVLTSVVFGGVWLYRAARRRLPGLGASRLHLAGMVAGLILLTLTGSLGGQLVYEHGVGVARAAGRPVAGATSRANPSAGVSGHAGTPAADGAG